MPLFDPEKILLPKPLGEQNESEFSWFPRFESFRNIAQGVRLFASRQPESLVKPPGIANRLDANNGANR